MSGLVGSLNLQAADWMSKLPLTNAQVQQTYAQAGLAGAQAQEAQARAGYYGPLSTKAQLEAEQIDIQNQIQRGILNAPKTPPSQAVPPWHTSQTGTGYPATSGGSGAGGIGPSPTDSGEAGSGKTAVLGYTTAEPVPASAMLATYGTTAQPTAQSTLPYFGTTEAVPSGQQPQIGGTFEDVPGAFPQRPPISGLGTYQPATVTPVSQQPLPPPAQQPAQPTPTTAPVVSPPIPPTTRTQLAQAGPGSMQLQSEGSGAGTFVQGVGMLPNWDAAVVKAAMASDPKNSMAIMNQARVNRNNYIRQALSEVNSRQGWNDLVDRLWSQGYLNTVDGQTYYDHPEQQQKVMRMLLPDQGEGQDREMAGHFYSWNGLQYVFDPNLAAGQMPVKTGRGYMVGNRFYPEIATPAQIAAQSGAPTMPYGGIPGGAATPRGPGVAPPPPGPAAAPGAPGPGADTGATGRNPYVTYATNTAQAESGGVAQPNREGSSADGIYQWMPGTFADQMREMHPELTQGLSNDEIMSRYLRANNGQYEHEAMANFTAHNAVSIAEQGGRVSGKSLYLAHLLGADGLKALTRYPSNTRLADIPELQSAVRANRILQGNTTIGGLAAYATRVGGNDTITAEDIAQARGVQLRPEQQPPAAAPTPAPAQPAPEAPPPAPAPAPAAQPAAPAGPTGPPTAVLPEVGPGVADRIAQDRDSLNRDYAAATEARTNAAVLQRNNPTILDVRNRLQEIHPGAGFDTRAAFNNIIQTWMPERMQDWLHWATGKKLDTPEQQAAAIKEFLVLATQQEAQMPGVRSGLGLTQLMQHASPSGTMPQETIRQLLNAMLVRNQAVQDFAQGYTRMDQRAEAWRQDNVNNPYTPVQPELEGEWTKTGGVHSAKVYQAATDILNSHSFGDWAQRYKLTQAEANEAAAIAMRADPQLKVADNQRKPTGYKWP